MNNKLSIILAGLVFAGCATVPITGRKQLSLVSNSELITLSFQNYSQVLTETRVSKNKEQVDLIKGTGLNIQKAVEAYMKENGLSSQLEGFAWDFNLLENDTVANAWCMPGGKVAFYTGILPVCDGEDGVAVVMGHEIAHAIANHSRERMSQQMAVNGILSVGSAATESTSGLVDDIFLQSVGIGSQIGMLKFSRNNESEADRMGLIFMAMAGYDPEAAPEFWQRMKTMSGGSRTPEWLSTHPSNEQRISDIKSWIPEAKSYAENSAAN